jgi:hypothetical protein
MCVLLISGIYRHEDTQTVVRATSFKTETNRKENNKEQSVI